MKEEAIIAPTLKALVGIMNNFNRTRIRNGKATF